MLILLVLCALAFALRAHYACPIVLAGTETRFLVGDSWYHVRLVESLVRHFPYWNTFDPYAVYPGGQIVPVAPLVPWILAGLSLVAGWGDPTPRAIELVCAYYPAVLGSLTLLPVYALGRRLLDRTAGLLAAGLLAISPGQFLSRSLVGYTDHHVAEVFLGTVFILACVIALGPARDSTPTTTARALLNRCVGKPVLHAVLAGICLGLYLLTWLGGSMLVALFVLWFGVQSVLDHVGGRPVRRLLTLALPALLVAAVFMLAWNTELIARRLDILALGGGVATVLLLAGLSGLMRRWQLPGYAYPVTILGAIGVLAAVVLVSPGLVGGAVLTEVTRLGFARWGGIIPEAEPLLVVGGQWSFARAWSQFSTAFFLALPGLAFLAYRAARQGDSRYLLVSVWSAGMLAATLAQNRFSYYYAVNAALLTGYIAAFVLARFQVALRERLWRANSASITDASGDASPPGNHLPSPHRAGWPSSVGLYAFQLGSGLVMFLLLFYFSIGQAMRAASRVFVPPADWIAAMRWMRENTPEPFGDPEAYYAYYQAPRGEGGYDYPDSAYGVMCSWSYGYWVLRMAHRIPNANPGQHGAEAAARFFTAQDQASAIAILRTLGSRYIVIDSTMPYMEAQPGGSVVGRLRSLAHWAGLPWTRFCEEWRFRDRKGQSQTFTVYYPEYYQTLLARLYIFRGQAIDPTECFVMSFRERVDDRGKPYKELTGAKRFAGYAAAWAYHNAQPPGATRIVGTDPYESCVPLEHALTEFRLVYRSPTIRQTLRGEPAACVEVYEYGGDLTASRPSE